MSNYVTPELNRQCAFAEVQLTITADPSDFKKLYQFKNLGGYGVELTQGKARYILNPGEELSLKGEEPKFTQWFFTYDSEFNR